MKLLFNVNKLTLADIEERTIDFMDNTDKMNGTAWEGTEHITEEPPQTTRPDNYFKETQTTRELLVKEIDSITGGNYSFYGLMNLAAIALGHYAIAIRPNVPDTAEGEGTDTLTGKLVQEQDKLLGRLCKEEGQRAAVLNVLAKYAPAITDMTFMLAPLERSFILTPLRAYYSLVGETLVTKSEMLGLGEVFPDIEQQAGTIPADKLRQLVFSYVEFVLGNFKTNHAAQYEHIETVRDMTAELMQTPTAYEIRQEWDNYTFNAGFCVEEGTPTAPLLWYLEHYRETWNAKHPTISGYNPEHKHFFATDIVDYKTYYDNKLYFSGELTTLNMAGESAKNAREAILKLSQEEGINALTPGHIFVQAALAGLWEAGDKLVTRTKIWQVMQGLTGEDKHTQPSEDQLNKIGVMLKDLRLTRLEFDNASEAKETKYPRFQYKGVLVPTEEVRLEIKGKWTDWAVRILREPPLYTFAKERRQLEKFDFKLINIPGLNNTADTNSLKAYFLRQLYLDKPPCNTTDTGEVSTTKSRKKKKATRHAYSFNTAFGTCGINGKQRSRLKPAIVKMFEHWKNEGIIEDYFTETKPEGRKPTQQEIKSIVVDFPEQL